MSYEYENKLYRGCYPSSKQYLGSKKASEYCYCVIKKLSEKYIDSDMDFISKQNEIYQLKMFSFVYEYCSNNLTIN